MPSETIEVSKADWDKAQAAFKLLDHLYTSPKVGLKFKHLLKEDDEKRTVPELDIAEQFAAPIRNEIEALKKERAEEKAEREKEKQEEKDRSELRSLTDQIDKVVKDRGLTDEGRAGLIKLMQERKVIDPEIAVEAYLAKLPKAKVSTPSPNFMPADMDLYGTHDGKDSPFKPFWDNSTRAFDNEVRKVLEEGPEAV